jgi:glucose-6-phosphate 1-epimerase
MYWNVAETSSSLQGETTIRLQLKSSEETKVYWPYDFVADLTVFVGEKLMVTLKITNTSSVPFEYGCALHSYYSVSSIDNITLEGLENTKYINQLQPGDFIQEEAALKIQQAETRHYQNTESTVILDDPYFRRRIEIAKAGSLVTTVWNPWAEACAKIPDLPDEAYHSFVCVESVNAFKDIIRLAPGESHETAAVISLGE